MSKHVAAVNVSPKAGVVVLTRWVVEQSRPYPDIERGRWRNGQGVFPEYGNTALGFGREYRAHLLAAGVEVVPNDWNRTILSGYDKNPSVLTYRGRELGELRAEIRCGPGWGGGGVTWRQAYPNEVPTTGVKEWLDASVKPYLLAYIDAHTAALYDEAVAGIKATLAERIADMRRDADRLEIEATGAVARLEADRP